MESCIRQRAGGDVEAHALLDGKPRRWRVENSWGDEKGESGYWTMNDSW